MVAEGPTWLKLYCLEPLIQKRRQLTSTQRAERSRQGETMALVSKLSVKICAVFNLLYDCVNIIIAHFFLFCPH